MVVIESEGNDFSPDPNEIFIKIPGVPKKSPDV